MFFIVSNFSREFERRDSGEPSALFIGKQTRLSEFGAA
jgi:hypothetical protein